MSALTYTAAKAQVSSVAMPDSRAYAGRRTAVTANAGITRMVSTPSWATVSLAKASTTPATSARDSMKSPWNWRASTTAQKPDQVSGLP